MTGILAGLSQQSPIYAQRSEVLSGVEDSVDSTRQAILDKTVTNGLERFVSLIKSMPGVQTKSSQEYSFHEIGRPTSFVPEQAVDIESVETDEISTGSKRTYEQAFGLRIDHDGPPLKYARMFKGHSFESTFFDSYSSIRDSNLFDLLSDYIQLTGDKNIESLQLYLPNLAESIVTSVGTYDRIQGFIEGLDGKITGSKIMESVTSNSFDAFSEVVSDTTLNADDKNKLWGVNVLLNLESSRRLAGGAFNTILFKDARSIEGLSVKDAAGYICEDNVMSAEGASGKSEGTVTGKFARRAAISNIIDNLLSEGSPTESLRNIRNRMFSFLGEIRKNENYEKAFRHWESKAKSRFRNGGVDRTRHGVSKALGKEFVQSLLREGSFRELTGEFKLLMSSDYSASARSDFDVEDAPTSLKLDEDKWEFETWLISKAASMGHESALKQLPELDGPQKGSFVSSLRDAYLVYKDGSEDHSEIKIAQKTTRIYDKEMGTYEDNRSLLRKHDGNQKVRTFMLKFNAGEELLDGLDETEKSSLKALKRVYYDIEPLRNPRLALFNLALPYAKKSGEGETQGLSLTDIFIDYNTLSPVGINSDSGAQASRLETLWTGVNFEDCPLGDTIDQTMELILRGYEGRLDVSLNEQLVDNMEYLMKEIGKLRTA